MLGVIVCMNPEESSVVLNAVQILGHVPLASEARESVLYPHSEDWIHDSSLEFCSVSIISTSTWNAPIGVSDKGIFYTRKAMECGGALNCNSKMLG